MRLCVFVSRFITRIASDQSTKPLPDILRHIYCLTNASSKNGLQTADEAFEDGIKKEATNPENFDDAHIHHNKEAVVESCWDAEKTIQLRILSMSLKMDGTRK